MTSLETAFQSEVALKYQLFNSLFLTLPIDQISNTGMLIPILTEYCERGLEKGQNPTEIINRFFEDHEQFADHQAQRDFLFRVIQYVERQVVLIDALEDAAYHQINDLNGSDSFHSLVDTLNKQGNTNELQRALAEYAVRIVLTAHPTQFYPGYVLAIITDLTEAIRQNNLDHIRQLLQQLGKTPFFRKQKPTPLDEAINLSWYLENVFYEAASELFQKIAATAQSDPANINKSLFQFGFWPGGDRDGNPFVNSETTLRVAKRLQKILIRCYYRDIRKLRRRLSFKGTYEQVMEIELKLAELNSGQRQIDLTAQALFDQLDAIKSTLQKDHGGLFVELVEALQNKVRLFGMHFASIDVRQDSRVIKRTFQTLADKQPGLLPADWDDMAIADRAAHLFTLSGTADPSVLADDVERDTLESFGVIRQIQQQNGTRGAHRYIISNCRTAVDIARAYALAGLGGWQDQVDIDIIPLFETIDDLERAAETMSIIYENPVYKEHLARRNKAQTVMLGFSDGTKDGGYLSANWNIFKAKENITGLSRKYGIAVVFFDGRGGPPARGGGNTHKFYTSLGSGIENREIQLTIQGQTISSRYGIVTSAVHNLETLLAAGLENQLVRDESKQLNTEQRAIIEELAQIGQAKYEALKASPHFMPYLKKMSPMLFYGEANIGSRPSKRGKGTELRFEDLRAIPFVGAWSQLKQNVPGFYGVGSALKQFKAKGKWEACKQLYQSASFFRALCENSMQSLSKTFFPVTEYMKGDPEFGTFWQDIYDEYRLSCSMLKEVSGQSELLETSPTSKQSIALREKVVLPLITIQQYALMALRELPDESPARDTYKKLVIRSMFGNINASRNSA
jgi:phosphoenolpyruvate carboxylase